MCGHLTLHELNTAEKLLVVSFRLWALPFAAPDRRHPDWRAGFRAAGIEDAAHTLFDPLLDTLFSASHRVIAVHRSMCVGISLDEREFLRCIGLRQNDRIDGAAQILAEWLPPTAARVAASLVGSLAEALRAAGLVLPLRQFELNTARQFPIGMGHGLHLLH